MNKRNSIYVALGLMVMGVVLIGLGLFGYVNADVAGRATDVAAIKALLVFGGSMMAASVIIFALFAM